MSDYILFWFARYIGEVLWGLIVIAVTATALAAFEKDKEKNK